MAKMVDPHRSTTAAARRRTVAEKYLKGVSQYAIADELGVSQPMVSKDLKIIRASWKESGIRDYDALKSEQLEKLARVEAAAWVGYAKSQLDGERTVKERAPGGDRVSVTTEKRAGDKGFLGVILSCIAQRCRLLGLEEPARVTIDWSHITEEQLIRLSNGEPAREVLFQPGPSPMAQA